VILDVAQDQDAADRRHIQVAVMEGYPDRPLQPRGDHPHAVGAAVVIAVGQRVHLAGVRRAGEDRTPRAQRDLPRVGHTLGVDSDVESGGQGQATQVDRCPRGCGREDQKQAQGEDKASFHGKRRSPVLHLVGRRASCFRTPASDAAELLTAYGVGEVPGTVDVGIYLRQAVSMADTFAAAACARPPIAPDA